MKWKANLDSHILSFLFQGDMLHLKNRKEQHSCICSVKKVSLCISLQDSQVADKTIMAFDSPCEVEMDISM